MNRRSFARKMTIAAAGMVLGAFAAFPAAQAAETIKVGTFLSVTGPASFLGDPELKTLQLYVDKINAAGGVMGRQLELVHYDVGVDAEKARTATKRLIDQDGVDAIVGGSTSGQTMAVVPIVEKAGVPFISLAGSIKIVEPVKKWVFKTPHTDRMACGKIFEDLKGRGLNKIALISGSGGFGKSMRGQCQGIAADYGLEIVADETYGPKDSDMTAQLTKIKGAAGVQALVNAGFGQGPAIVTRNYKQLGMAVPLYQSHGVASKKYIELSGDAAEGVRLPAAAILVPNQLASDDPQKKVVEDYIAAYEGAYDSAVSTFGGHAHDGLLMLIDAMQRAGGTDKEKVRAELEATSNFVGTGGVVNMSASDHLGLDLSAFKMLEIKGGDWTLAK